jgi:hypothetical protein
MNDAVTITAERASPQARRLVKSPAAAHTGIGGTRQSGGSHSNRHRNYSTFGV